MLDLNGYEVWFVTGSQHLYGPDDAPNRRGPCRRISRPPWTRPRPSRSVSCQAGAHRSDAIRRLCQEANAAPRPASGSSPGCTRSHQPRCGSPAWRALQKPLLHLHTQYNSEIPWADDRHGLHEPEPVRPRRPRVRVHRRPAAPRAQGRRRPLAGCGRPATGSAPGRGPPAPGATGRRPDRALWRQHARRRRHGGRQGGGRSVRLGFTVNGYGVGDLVQRRRGGHRRGSRRPRRASIR